MEVKVKIRGLIEKLQSDIGKMSNEKLMAVWHVLVILKMLMEAEMDRRGIQYSVKKE